MKKLDLILNEHQVTDEPRDAPQPSNNEGWSRAPPSRSMVRAACDTGAPHLPSDDRSHTPAPVARPQSYLHRSPLSRTNARTSIDVTSNDWQGARLGCGRDIVPAAIPSEPTQGAATPEMVSALTAAIAELPADQKVRKRGVTRITRRLAFDATLRHCAHARSTMRVLSRHTHHMHSLVSVSNCTAAVAGAAAVVRCVQEFADYYLRTMEKIQDESKGPNYVTDEARAAFASLARLGNRFAHLRVVVPVLRFLSVLMACRCRASRSC